MKRMTAICLLSTLLTSQACSAEIANTQVPSSNSKELNARLDVNQKANRTNEQSEVQTGPANKTSIKNSKGLIVLSDRYSKTDLIRFYNDDGSLWYEFTFYYDDKDGKFEYENDNFAPLAFHQDYFLLALKCTGEEKNRYEVIVNEDTGLKKFVKKDDPALKFQSWEDHVKGAFAVKFDEVENQLRESPEGKVENAKLPVDVTFHPVEVNGAWLKVRWNGSKGSKKDSGSGWVKWRDDNQILVELFYFA
jgi:hypothetical protein